MDEKEKKYLNTLIDTMQKTKVRLKKEKGGFLKELSSNIPFVLFLVIGSFAGAGYALMSLTSLGNFVFPISAGIALTTGVGIPKFLHTIFEKSNGKFGRSYAKHNFQKYYKAMIDFLNSKDCDKILSNPNNIYNLSTSQINNIKKQLHFFTKNLYLSANKLILNKVTKRTSSDLNSIKKLIEKIDTNPNKEAKITKQIKKIVDKNIKFVSPWCNLYNQCESNAKKLFDLLKEWDNTLEVPNVSLLNATYLSEKVVKLLGDNKKNDEIFEQKQIKKEIPSSIQSVENKAKNVSTFEELKTYLQKKHNKTENKAIAVNDEMNL